MTCCTRKIGTDLAHWRQQRSGPRPGKRNWADWPQTRGSHTKPHWGLPNKISTRNSNLWHHWARHPRHPSLGPSCRDTCTTVPDNSRPLCWERLVATRHAPTGGLLPIECTPRTEGSSPRIKQFKKTKVLSEPKCINISVDESVRAP